MRRWSVARPWSPSFVAIDRTTARCFICFATSGRCSPTRTPGAAVSIAWNGPPFAWSGLGSKVSVWVGPPAIHSTMHARLRAGSSAARAARVGSQPEVSPAADSFSALRRESDVRMGPPVSD